MIIEGRMLVGDDALFAMAEKCVAQKPVQIKFITKERKNGDTVIIISNIEWSEEDGLWMISAHTLGGHYEMTMNYMDGLWPWVEWIAEVG